MDSVESRKEHIVNLIDSQAGLCRGPLACRLSGPRRYEGRLWLRLAQRQPPVSAAVQGTVSPQFLRIDDLKTLHETIGVNVDAGGSHFSASADVKAQYAKECNMSQLVRVSVQNAFENFDDPVR